MIIIHAYMNVKQEKREEFLELANGVASASQAEAGCMSYRFYEDPNQPGQVVFVEAWQDAAAVKFHGETPHFQAFVAGVSSLLQEPWHADVYEAEPKR
ncbi:putative quinol monooxygenase [Ectobacillus ponti]|uniref:Antibiotic biosynthesis monooxygenase n=1 Tax=Ectobacillus ponti TaxID=2961894 RepID=A0AA42BT03_9BACI|nr:putative quinol monooxygenase [Ectobacillus ponti]MCP8968983.1 antibiotic biosynthesis monooxygenase [Ectobacillus ponti]